MLKSIMQLVPNIYYARREAQSVLATATWLAGGLSQPVLYQND